MKLKEEALAMIMWKLKGCPRCGGDMFVENSPNGWHEQCLQCSYERDLEAEPAFIRRSRLHQVRSEGELATVGSR